MDGTYFVTAVAVCADYLKMLHNDSEIKLAERSANKAILLLNKVKFKYVNITNAIDYACEKYHVRRASELNQLWQYYMDAVRERENINAQMRILNTLMADWCGH